MASKPKTKPKNKIVEDFNPPEDVKQIIPKTNNNELHRIADLRRYIDKLKQIMDISKNNIDLIIDTLSVNNDDTVLKNNISLAVKHLRKISDMLEKK